MNVLIETTRDIKYITTIAAIYLDTLTARFNIRIIKIIQTFWKEVVTIIVGITFSKSVVIIEIRIRKLEE